jgi:hypothetical protein
MNSQIEIAVPQVALVPGKKRPQSVLVPAKKRAAKLSTAVRHEVRDWFQDERQRLADYVTETLPGLSKHDANAVIERIEEKLRLCTAMTRDKFVVWAMKKIVKEPGFRGSVAAIKNLDLDVLGLLNNAELAYDRKCFISEQRGDVLHVDMGEDETGKQRVWKLPTDETAAVVIQRTHYTLADLAERLWPCFLRPLPTGYQVTKKIHGVNVHVARLMFGARDDEQVKFHNDDSLDYTNGNVYMVSNRRGVAVNGAYHLDAQEMFERDILFRTGWNMEATTTGPTHAKATRPKGAAPDAGGDRLDWSVVDRRAEAADARSTRALKPLGVHDGSYGTQRASSRPKLRGVVFDTLDEDDAQPPRPLTAAQAFDEVEDREPYESEPVPEPLEDQDSERET